MSYDLFFIKNKRKFLKTDFVEYFQSRPLYNIEGNQAWYSNEDTGVYFCFEYQDENSENLEELEASTKYIASFNINYNRPHIFGLEAEPEVKSFVDKFKLNIFDPQMNGMEDGPYTSEGFLQGWNEGNLFGITAMMHQNGVVLSNYDLATLPYVKIEHYWKWNYVGQNYKKKLEAKCLFPK